MLEGGRTDGRTDLTNLTAGIHNFANALKRKYSTGVALNGKTFIPWSVKIGQIFRKLQVHTDSKPSFITSFGDYIKASCIITSATWVATRTVL